MLENEAPGARNEAKIVEASWTLGTQGAAPDCSWAPLGALLAALRADLGPSWGLLGRSWDLLSRSWGSCWPPGELCLELFGVSVFERPCKKKVKTLIFADCSSLFMVF